MRMGAPMIKPLGPRRLIWAKNRRDIIPKEARMHIIETQPIQVEMCTTKASGPSHVYFLKTG